MVMLKTKMFHVETLFWAVKPQGSVAALFPSGCHGGTLDKPP